MEIHSRKQFFVCTGAIAACLFLFTTNLLLGGNVNPGGMTPKVVSVIGEEKKGEVLPTGKYYPESIVEPRENMVSILEGGKKVTKVGKTEPVISVSKSKVDDLYGVPMQHVIVPGVGLVRMAFDDGSSIKLIGTHMKFDIPVSIEWKYTKRKILGREAYIVFLEGNSNSLKAEGVDRISREVPVDPASQAVVIEKGKCQIVNLPQETGDLGNDLVKMVALDSPENVSILKVESIIIGSKKTRLKTMLITEKEMVAVIPSSVKVEDQDLTSGSGERLLRSVFIHNPAEGVAVAGTHKIYTTQKTDSLREAVVITENDVVVVPKS